MRVGLKRFDVRVLDPQPALDEVAARACVDRLAWGLLCLSPLGSHRATASETAGQLGHQNPTITTGIYMVAMKHRARLSQAERAAFAEAIAWASMGTSAQSTGLELVPAPEAEVVETA